MTTSMTTSNNRNFDFSSTTDQVLDGIDLSGVSVLVTGAGSGLGAETVRAMAAKGAAITLAGRNRQQLQAVCDAVGSNNLSILEFDLASYDSITKAAEKFCSDNDSLNILINNAGVMACPYTKTKDGFEMQFGTNHLGHFLFTNLIMPTLLKSASSGADTRIVSLSSLGHRTSPVVFDDICFVNRDYEKWIAYGQSKTANSLFAVGLEQRLADKGVHALAVHPGVIRTNLGRHMTKEDIEMMSKRYSDNDTSDKDPSNKATATRGMKTVEQGAATQVYAATAPELAGVGGVYLEDNHIAETISSSSAQPDLREGVLDYAIDPDGANELWRISQEMVHTTFEY